MEDDLAAQAFEPFVPVNVIAPAAEPLGPGQLPTNEALSAEAFRLHMIMRDKSRGLNVTTSDSANALKRMHILTARAVGTAGAPQWAQDLTNTMQQGFLHVNEHVEESFKSVKAGMTCLWFASFETTKRLIHYQKIQRHLQSGDAS
jgi:hypothetical protein